MGTVRTDSNTVDYTEDYQALNDKLDAINQTIASKLDVIILLLNGGKPVEYDVNGNIIEVPLERIADGLEGQDEGDGGLSRAATINALEASGQLQAVRDEMLNPTQMP